MFLWNSPTGAFHGFILFSAVAGTFHTPNTKRGGADFAFNCDELKASHPLQDVPIPTFPPFDREAATVKRYRQQRSVNLGSWFVHENWMTPSVFAGASGHKVSELDIAFGWNSPDCARRVLETHWGNFITPADFSHLADLGINTVRLPIGYWSLGPIFCQGTPFEAVADVYHNSWSFVVQAILMAGKYDIGVLVDLHGAVGSQNGEPHSGISDHRIGLLNSAANINKTLDVLTFLTQQLGTVTNVVGIQLLNEPKDDPQLVGFYTRAIKTMREVSSAAGSLPFYLHDAFDLTKLSDFIASRTDFVVQDHHSYFVFTPQDEQKNASQHTDYIRTSYKQALAATSANQRGNLIIGEWSCALTPQSLSTEDNEDEARRNFCTTQLETYSNVTTGWSFWAYKTENCDTNWCFVSAVGSALPSNFRTNGCNPRESDDNSDSLQRWGKVSPSSILPRDLDFVRSMSPRYRLAANHYQRRMDTDGTTAQQQSETQGYLDGRFAAQTFCKYDSTLGFVGQFIMDSIKKHGPTVIAPGTESYYGEGFRRGLSEGEGSVNGLL